MPTLSRTLPSVLVPMLTLIACLLPHRALAQDLGIKAPAQDSPVAIVNASIYPVSGPPIERGYILFDAGVIKAIAPITGDGGGDAPIFTANTRIIDGTGKRVYPGLISPFSQLGIVEIGAVRASRDTAETGEITPEARAIVAVNPDSTFFPVTRKNGVLLAATFPVGGIIPGRPGIIRMDGWTWEQMSLPPDNPALAGEFGLYVQWPMMRVIRAWWMDTPEDEQRKNIADNAAIVRNAFLQARAYLARREADASTPIDVRWEAMRGIFGTATTPAPRATFVQAADYDQIMAAIALARELHLRLVIIGGHDAWLAREALKRDNIPVILTCVVDLPRRDDAPYDDFFTLPARLKAEGITFAIASGDETPHERNLPYAPALAIAHGLAPADALRSVTLDVATIFGINQRYGSLEVGKSATLLLATGDVLEVSTNIEQAFIDGRAINLRSKQSDLADKYREKYRQQPRPAATPASAPGPTPAPAPAPAP